MSSPPSADKAIYRPERTSSSSVQGVQFNTNEPTASSNQRVNIRRRRSPYLRQHDLATRLKATLEPQKKPGANDDDVTRDGVKGSKPLSRKRPYPSPDEVQSNAFIPSQARNPPATLDSRQVWQELSSFLPLLTYGEESDELLYNLLRWAANPNHEFEERSTLLSSLEIFLEKMLRNRHDLTDNEISSQNHRRRVRPSSMKQKITAQREANSDEINIFPPNKSFIDSTTMLPWGVILRLTIRMARYVAKKILHGDLFESDNNNCDAKNCAEDGAEYLENEENIVHPLVQSLDFVLADLRIMMRMKRNSDVSRVFVDDRMLADWRVHPKYNNGRFGWGPSRQAFMKDLDATRALLELKVVKVDETEWKEKIHSIVENLDTCAREIRMPDETCVASSVNDNITSITAELGDGNLKSTSNLSNITRKHVLRLEQLKEQEIKLLPKNDATRANATFFQKQFYSDTVRRNSVQHTSVYDSAGIVISKEDEIDELQDAYRAALAFVADIDDSRGNSRETIERRFNFLVRRLHRCKNDERDENSENLNVHGAEAYLENLLCSLLKPSDPEVWVRLINESDGNETAADLRRGRSLLVSFLVGIRSPGWWNAQHQLCPSPLPSYLGFLSHREMRLPAKAKEDGAIFGSSMLLPSKSACSCTHLPIISELGLSLCIGDFLQKGAQKEELHYQVSKNNFGVSLFRNFGPFQGTKSNACNDSLQSISTPLPDIWELTQDLFDLTLRLAAADDGHNKNRRISPRLAAHTATESLKTLFQVLSDYSEWLTPHAIALRYRFVVTHVINSFKCIDFDENSLLVSGLGIDANDEGSWTKRAESLIETATSASVRGRILLYATQFMSMLATNRLASDQSTVQNSMRFVSHSHFYSCLQLRQISRFWNDVDMATKHSYSSNFISRVFDNSFCNNILLPLSHRFSMIVANSSMATLHKSHHTTQNKSSQSILSLLTILTSVLNVFAEDDLISDCLNLGWAVMMLALSANHFVFGVDFIANDEYPYQHYTDKSVWSHLAINLRKLYLRVWGEESPTFRGNARILHLNVHSDVVFYESNEILHRGSKSTIVLLPAFDALVYSLVRFASQDSKNSSSWCQYASNVLLRKYESAFFLGNKDQSVCEGCLHSNARFTFLSSWVRHLATNVQKIVLHHFVALDGGKKIGKSTFDESTDQMLNRLMTPLLRSLHANIMQQSFKSASPYDERNCSQCGIQKETSFISFIFVSLFREESEKFLTKPTPTKTRKWGVYKKCIEKLLLSTPASAIFSFPRTEGLSQYSADALECIWDQYCQCNLSNSTFIMIAAALHVNGSVPCISSRHATLASNDGSSASLKQYYDAFSCRAKKCITKSFDCFNRKEDEKTSVSANDMKTSNFSVMVCSVRRGLSSQRAEVGLCWWEEIISHLLRESGDRLYSTTSSIVENRKIRDIEKACSALEHDLSAISN